MVVVPAPNAPCNTPVAIRYSAFWARSFPLAGRSSGGRIIWGLMLIGSVAGPRLQAAEWQSLFNGKGPHRGWAPVHDVKFEAQDGELRLVRGMGWLRTEKEYGDFILEVEFRPWSSATIAACFSGSVSTASPGDRRVADQPATRHVGVRWCADSRRSPLRPPKDPDIEDTTPGPSFTSRFAARRPRWMSTASGSGIRPDHCRPAGT